MRLIHVIKSLFGCGVEYYARDAKAFRYELGPTSMRFERVGWLRYAVGNFKYWIGGKR